MFKAWMVKAWLITLLVYLLTLGTGHAAAFDHGLWNELLTHHVSSEDGGRNTVVDYRGMANHRGELKTYLDRLAQVSRSSFDHWSNEEQLAFLINAYNAWTVELVLTRYPDIDSIKDLGSLFRSPWKKSLVTLFDEMYSLDDIEHEWIRGSGRYNDPRIHFAVNCASVGCPPLRPEAYRGEQLDAQLQEQTRLFLSDQTRNRLTGDTLSVSSIFKWYREDFQKGWLGVRSLSDFFIQYRDAINFTDADIARLRSGALIISFLDYDWRLNAKKPGAGD